MIARPHDTELDDWTAGRTQRDRECAVRRPATVRPVADLIRFVVGPDGEAVPDLKRKLPGRGVWVTATRDALSRRGQAQGLCPRLQAGGSPAGRSRRRGPSGCWNVRRSTRWPWPARPAWSLTGFTRVEAALERVRRLSRLLHAAEAAADGVRKLDAALRRRPAARSDRCD